MNIDQIISLVFNSVLAFATLGLFVATCILARATNSYANTTRELKKANDRYVDTTERMKILDEYQFIDKIYYAIVVNRAGANLPDKYKKLLIEIGKRNGLIEKDVISEEQKNWHLISPVIEKIHSFAAGELLRDLAEKYLGNDETK